MEFINFRPTIAFIYFIIDRKGQIGQIRLYRTVKLLNNLIRVFIYCIRRKLKVKTVKNTFWIIMCCFSYATGNKETERSLFTIALFTDRKGKRFTNKL